MNKSIKKIFPVCFIVFLSGFLSCNGPADIVFPETGFLKAEKIPLEQIVLPSFVSVKTGYFVFTPVKIVKPPLFSH